MSDLANIAEILTRFNSEWVLLADPELDENLRVIRGRVVFHSKDRDEVYRRAVQLKLPSSATLFTGCIPEDTAVVL